MLTDIASVITTFILTVLTELVKLIKSKKVLAFVGGTVAAFALIVLGYIAHEIITPQTTTERGLDLARYCDSYGYANNTENVCYSNIDLDKACNWQYERADLHIVMGDDPYSGECYDTKENYVGGIDDMSGYCSDSFNQSASVKAALRDDKTWVCQITIDHELACQWQYQSKSLVARKEDGLWKCLET